MSEFPSGFRTVYVPILGCQYANAVNKQSRESNKKELAVYPHKPKQFFPILIGQFVFRKFVLENTKLVSKSCPKISQILLILGTLITTGFGSCPLIHLLDCPPWRNCKFNYCKLMNVMANNRLGRTEFILYKDQCQSNWCIVIKHFQQRVNQQPTLVL